MILLVNAAKFICRRIHTEAPFFKQKHIIMIVILNFIHKAAIDFSLSSQWVCYIAYG